MNKKLYPLTLEDIIQDLATKQSTVDLQDYQDAAFNRARNPTDARIRNKDLAHATILIKSMIGTAGETTDVGIYSGTLLQEAFEDALRVTRAKSIQITVDNYTDLGWLKELPSDQLKKISAWKVTPRKNHFFYTTDGAFRFEVDTKDYAAEANFHEPATVKKLQDAMTGYISSGTAIPV